MDASDWDERYAARELIWSAEPNVFVARECADLTPGRAVDLAAGEGRNAIWLARQGWDVTAVDWSGVGLAKGRQLAGDTALTWQQADATTWRPEARFDLAVLAYLQLPAEQRAAAVRNGFDALAPGGTFLLVGHDSTNLAEGTGGPQDPSVLYAAEDVLADLAGRSFETVIAERVSRVVAAPAGDGSHQHAGEAERIAWDCLVRLVAR
ncbi:MAG: class I SAM-dependent methyltransferase [Nocardioidaceae bacterium]|nr:class I SAM-dependent methyltransferase [Nocardioidaceae bacterium]